MSSVYNVDTNDIRDSKKIKSAHQDLKIISGQQPIITKAKKSIDRMISFRDNKIINKAS